MNRECSGINCTKSVEKGHLLCTTCLEARKSMSRTKKERDLNELSINTKKLTEYQFQIKILESKRKEGEEKYNLLKAENEELKRVLLEREINEVYETQNKNLLKIISELRLQIEKLIKERELCLVDYDQIKLDNTILKLEIERLKKLEVIHNGLKDDTNEQKNER